jgi:predicted alpha/beta superfamily hydrolase
MRTVLCCLALASLSAAASTLAQERHNVTFQTTRTTTVGQSVYVLGDLPELGGNDLRRAVKLEPSAYPNWRATISLPGNRTYAYRFYLRDDGPGRGGDVTNGTPITALTAASTPTVAPLPPTKTLFYHSGWTQPTLNWRPAGTTGTFQSVALSPFGPARGPTETRWFTTAAGPSRSSIEFFVTGSAPGGPAGRDPATGTYTTALDAVLLQDGQLFTYFPSAAPAAQRRDYNPASPPSVVSANLNGETRRYRVILPRGYETHTTRRYPVVFMHDGQNVFEVGPFGSWNAHTTADALTRSGQMREVVIVGVDNGPNRLTDYAAPDAGGQADRYARFLRDELKPLIDAQYRTIADAGVTGAVGSSMGGQVSLYLGWDFTTTFTRIGAMSGAFEIFNSGFYNRVRNQPIRPSMRLWLDSGDAGTASDNYWPIFNLRDNLLNPSRAGGAAYALSGNLQHAVGQGQQHNEAAWAARLPETFRFLYPASEDQAELFAAVNATFDVNRDGSIDLEDLAAQERSARDLNLDGLVSATDARALETFLRRPGVDRGPAAR